MDKLSDFILPPKKFTYSPWRHGGWYTNVRYPSGACGCVSSNYEDGKWRIACDPRPFEDRPTFTNRHEAAMAEWHLVESLKAKKTILALEAFENEFAALIESDDEMGGADTVDAVCRVWPMVKAALEAVRGAPTDYTTKEDA